MYPNLIFITETVPDIKTCMMEVDNCFSILLPTPDDFFLDVESSEDKECLTNVEKQKKSETEKSGIMHCSDSEKSLQSDKGDKDDSCENCLKNQNYNEKTVGMNKDQRNSIKISCTHSSESSEKNVMYTENSEHGKLVEPESSKHSCVSVKPSIFSNVESDSQTSEKHEKGVDSEVSSSSSSDADDDLEEVGEFVQEHGLRNHQYSIAIDLQRGPVQLEENEDNLPVLTTLKDHYRLISTKHQPSVTRWLQVTQPLTANATHQSGIDTCIKHASCKSKLELQVHVPVDCTFSSPKSTIIP